MNSNIDRQHIPCKSGIDFFLSQHLANPMPLKVKILDGLIDF